jgi:uncharacterized phage protein gp47/JayE
MAVTFKTYEEIINSVKASLEAFGSGITDFRTGSRIGAIISSFSAALADGWNELAALRASFFVNTAAGDDLDNRVSDFGLSRTQGTRATGVVIVAKKAGAPQIVTIPQGTILLTSDGANAYEVLNTKFVSSETDFIPVAALLEGSELNISGGTVLLDNNSQFVNTLAFIVGSGFDENGSPIGDIGGGTDPESDESLRTRFPLYLQSLARATEIAVRQAVLGVPGVSAAVVKSGEPVPGYITVSIPSSSGNIGDELPVSLYTAVENALEEWKAVGIGVIIKPVERLDISVVCNAYIPTGSTISPVVWETTVKNAILALNPQFTLGKKLRRSELIKVGNIDGLDNFELVQPAADIIPTSDQIISLTVRVNVLNAN